VCFEVPPDAVRELRGMMERVGQAHERCRWCFEGASRDGSSRLGLRCRHANNWGFLAAWRTRGLAGRALGGKTIASVGLPGGRRFNLVREERMADGRNSVGPEFSPSGDGRVPGWARCWMIGCGTGLAGRGGPLHHGSGWGLRCTGRFRRRVAAVAAGRWALPWDAGLWDAVPTHRDVFGGDRGTINRETGGIV